MIEFCILVRKAATLAHQLIAAPCDEGDGDKGTGMGQLRIQISERNDNTHLAQIYKEAAESSIFVLNNQGDVFHGFGMLMVCNFVLPLS